MGIVGRVRWVKETTPEILEKKKNHPHMKKTTPSEKKKNHVRTTTSCETTPNTDCACSLVPWGLGWDLMDLPTPPIKNYHCGARDTNGAKPRQGNPPTQMTVMVPLKAFG